MALYEVQLCENYQIQPLSLAQVAPEKNSRDQSCDSRKRHPENGIFSPDDSLGLQQSLCNLNSSLGISMSKYQRKNLLKLRYAHLLAEDAIFADL